MTLHLLTARVVRHWRGTPSETLRLSAILKEGEGRSNVSQDGYVAKEAPLDDAEAKAGEARFRDSLAL